MPIIVDVALPVPAKDSYEYQVASKVMPGCRVRVSFANRTLTGYITALADNKQSRSYALKSIRAQLDAKPILPHSIITLLQWAAGYYHHPLGEVYATAYQAILADRPPPPANPILRYYSRPETAEALSAIRRFPLLKKIYHKLQMSGDTGLDAQSLKALSPNWLNAISRLGDRGLVEEREMPPSAESESATLSLNANQMQCLKRIFEAGKGFHCHLLHGVTGSGKTEVYIELAREVIASGKQILILAPEIALTPQLHRRFTSRLGIEVGIMHSAIPATKRRQSWWDFAQGRLPVLIGTRSAVFSPMQNPGMIIIDEEHDGSFKQQEGFRYHARDLAIYRAHLESIPVILGTATPSLETLHNCRNKKYRYHTLTERAQTAERPRIHCIDLRLHKAHNGITTPILEAIKKTHSRGEQSLVFINRRGYSPLTICYFCGWQAACEQCDAKLVYHLEADQFRCHLCDRPYLSPTKCPTCRQGSLVSMGAGTERVTLHLQQALPEARILRVDSDSITSPKVLQEVIESVRNGSADILIGTQILSKGHDFPNITLICIINVDHSLFSLDFRAPEQLLQQLTQVAGRAGRGDKPGTVLLQTQYPDHPYYLSLLAGDQEGFLGQVLSERKAAGYPPFSHLAMLRINDPDSRRLHEQMRRFYNQGRQLQAKISAEIDIFDPVSANIARQGGRHHGQILLRAMARQPLHRFLDSWLEAIRAIRLPKSLRWSLDVDPMQMH